MYKRAFKVCVSMAVLCCISSYSVASQLPMFLDTPSVPPPSANAALKHGLQTLENGTNRLSQNDGN